MQSVIFIYCANSNFEEDFETADSLFLDVFVQLISLVPLTESINQGLEYFYNGLVYIQTINKSEQKLEITYEFRHVNNLMSYI